jgi:hypothetical protein
MSAALLQNYLDFLESFNSRLFDYLEQNHACPLQVDQSSCRVHDALGEWAFLGWVGFLGLITVLHTVKQKLEKTYDRDEEVAERVLGGERSEANGIGGAVADEEVGGTDSDKKKSTKKSRSRSASKSPKSRGKSPKGGQKYESTTKKSPARKSDSSSSSMRTVSLQRLRTFGFALPMFLAILLRVNQFEFQRFSVDYIMNYHVFSFLDTVTDPKSDFGVLPQLREPFGALENGYRQVVHGIFGRASERNSILDLKGFASSGGGSGYGSGSARNDINNTDNTSSDKTATIEGVGKVRVLGNSNYHEHDLDIWMQLVAVVCKRIIY